MGLEMIDSEKIKNTSEYREYCQAKEALERDQTALELLKEYVVLNQKEFVEPVEWLELEKDLERSPICQHYLLAEKRYLAKLKEFIDCNVSRCKAGCHKEQCSCYKNKKRGDYLG